MCDTCGCGQPDHTHDHKHDHAHRHDHDHQQNLVKLHEDIMSRNDNYADQNRAFFKERGIFALNLVSSPGSGKTTLIEKTLRMLAGKFPVTVIEGDQQTDRDAARIKAAGAQALQINTGAGCHLDGHQIAHALEALDVPDNSLMIIENVGNLVCPSMFDLGEHHKVVILSVTEGEDKPIKYPHMFHASDVLIYNKTDLLPYVDFDLKTSREFAETLRQDYQYFELSAKTEAGMEDWVQWLTQKVQEAGLTKEK